MKFSPIILVAVLATLLAGCGDFMRHMLIQSNRTAYEKWIATNRGFLLAVPKPLVFKTDFTIIDYGKGVVCPIFEYYFKAGDWDGVLEVMITFDTDANGAITSVREERLTFLALPPSAPYSNRSDGGRLRHSYNGLELPTSDLVPLVDRIVKGDDFDDLRERSHKEGRPVMSCLLDTDDMAGLRAGTAPEPPPPPYDPAQKRRILLPPY